MSAFENFLGFLEKYWAGIAILIVIVFLILRGIHFLARLFCWGKYKNITHDKKDGAMFLIGDFFSKIINDFRHLLAITIVMIFFIILLYSIIVAENQNERLDSIQKIFASLGMLLSSIIGFYFGEAKGRQAGKNQQDDDNDNPPSQDDTMEVAKTPNNLNN